MYLRKSERLVFARHQIHTERRDRLQQFVSNGNGDIPDLAFTLPYRTRAHL